MPPGDFYAAYGLNVAPAPYTALYADNTKKVFFPILVLSLPPSFFLSFSYHLLMGTKPFPQLRSGHADGFWVKKNQCSRENKTLECVGGTFAHAHKNLRLQEYKISGFCFKESRYKHNMLSVQAKTVA